jgi:hypothetical protein
MCTVDTGDATALCGLTRQYISAEIWPKLSTCSKPLPTFSEGLATADIITAWSTPPKPSPRVSRLTAMLATVWIVTRMTSLRARGPCGVMTFGDHSLLKVPEMQMCVDWVTGASAHMVPVPVRTHSCKAAAAKHRRR